MCGRVTLRHRRLQLRLLWRELSCSRNERRAGDFIDALIIIYIMDLCVLSPKKLPRLRACMRLYNKKLPTWASVVLVLHSPIFSARIIVLNSLFHTCFLQITVKVTNEFTMNKDNQHSISRSFVAEGLG